MSEPKLTTLSFSGGKQSSALLWMVLRGDIAVPKDFVVLNADPGMENSNTYVYVEMMKQKCADAGIEFYTVKGPNLYNDIMTLKDRNVDRIDNPPYWTKSPTGKLGRLMQECTQVYKIYPMDRMVRTLLHEKFGISKDSRRIGVGTVEKWIGFSYSEVERIKGPRQKYVTFRYPLIDLKMNNQDVMQYFIKNNLPIPPRSVCNACFANGLDTLKEMYHNRPADWQQAVNVDNSVRDWTQIHVRDEVYVSQTLIPLEQLAEIDFDISKVKKDVENDYSCDSGYCFL